MVIKLKNKNRAELMVMLNYNLGINYNWSRLNKLDLVRLVEATEKFKWYNGTIDL